MINGSQHDMQSVTPTRPTTQPPSIQRLGSAVLLQGPILAELRWVLSVGISVVSKRDAIVPTSLLSLRSELARAIADSGNAATRDYGDLEDSISDGCGTAEAAERLGLQPRQIRNMSAQLAGRKVGHTWIFDREAVEAEAARRREE